MASDVYIICSRSKCKRPAVVCRWYVEIGPCPKIAVYLCDSCKDIPLFTEDVIKEENLR